MNQITKIRDQYQLSRAELANLLAVSVRTLEGWESGRFQPSGSAAKLIQLLGASPQSFQLLKAFKGDQLMINLERDPEKLTIMGVPFSSAKAYQSAVSALANNMYEGYEPTVVAVRHLANDDLSQIDPQAILKQVEAEQNVSLHG
ncbi:helix-turn-helix domain-containing protein [Lactiplantibacillus daowaiensis]|uniref:Helix-turn-helix domain-containing protein n=1 Tax=Lactiplantibacillus daowaiensis TaxID=2559918 RepID=A0ABW1S1L7_9LACO|nr:helix-turn-helix domain-containing protein [Lactiplantibacillus daowaiensis]